MQKLSDTAVVGNHLLLLNVSKTKEMVFDFRREKKIVIRPINIMGGELIHIIGQNLEGIWVISSPPHYRGSTAPSPSDLFNPFICAFLRQSFLPFSVKLYNNSSWQVNMFVRHKILHTYFCIIPSWRCFLSLKYPYYLLMQFILLHYTL